MLQPLVLDGVKAGLYLKPVTRMSVETSRQLARKQPATSQAEPAGVSYSIVPFTFSADIASNNCHYYSPCEPPFTVRCYS